MLNCRCYYFICCYLFI